MKAVMILFDTLSRNFLSAYGNDWVKTPNFQRLAQHSVTFNQFYAGSLPCIPARRELHTGSYNFLHRCWGPLEPYDFSVMEELKKNNIYTHLITDHTHYWEDGGATYHNRFTTWEGFRGQEDDHWQPLLGEMDIPKQNELTKKGVPLLHNWKNRSVQKQEQDMPSVKTMTAGIEFLQKNWQNDNWFLQIECFDPHEPFSCPQNYRDLYADDYDGDYFDWPAYQQISSKEHAAELRHIRNQYAALITMCDTWLGKILDTMDQYGIWDDTLLLVNADHGFLLGEHDWIGKNIPPMYDEIVHLPFFIWDPRSKKRGERSSQLAQTVDIVPTLLDYFGVPTTKKMDGRSLFPILEQDACIRQSALFGIHGGHVNFTDGDYVLMKAAASPENAPLYQYTLMPSLMRGFMPAEDLNLAGFVSGGRYSAYNKVLKIPSTSYVNSHLYGDMLFHIAQDEKQTINICSDTILLEKYTKLLTDAMVAADAPKEQFTRLGLEYAGDR